MVTQLASLAGQRGDRGTSLPDLPSAILQWSDRCALAESDTAGEALWPVIGGCSTHRYTL